nr:FG-GAP-like repeat-containing protein [Defluviimonas salinarum]
MVAWVGGQQVASDRVKKNPFNRNNPVCTGPGAGVVQLVVSGQNGISRPDTVVIGNINLRPVLTRGARLSVLSGEGVSLSAPPLSFDANGDALTHGWSLLSRPGGSGATIAADPAVKTVAGDSLAFAPDRVGLYLIQLTADDGALLGAPVVLEVEVVNSPPVAVASGDTEAHVGETATFNGTASHDPDGDVLNYRWTLTSRPQGSSAAVSDPFGPIATLSPDRRGSYTLSLEVSDYEFTSAPVEITMTAPNRAPVAVLEGPSEINLGAETSYSAAASSDPDNDPLTYSYQITAQPTGADPLLADLGNGGVGFVADLPGNYRLEVSVSDGLLTTTRSLDITARPRNAPPVLGDLRDRYTVELGLEFALDLQGTDPDGDPITFYATPLPLAQGVALNANSGAIRFRPEAGQIGTYSFTVGVSDGTLTDHAILTVDVVAGTADDTSVHGRVLNANDFADGVETPLAGMPVRLRDAALMTTTAADGTFSFGSLAPGRDQVTIDPSADGGPGGYLGEVRAITVTENQNRDLSPEFLLVPLDDGCATVVAGQQTVLSGADSGLTVSIPANSVKDASGAAYTGDVCLGSLPDLFEHPGFVDGTRACRIYALDAPGAVFTQGMTITGPNLDNLPEQTRLELWRVSSLNGRFRRTADAGVDAGGATVSSTLSRFDESDLFTFLPQAPQTIVSADQPTGMRALTPFEGDNAASYTLPGYTAFGEAQQVTLSYHSQAANPTIIVAADVTIAEDASLPVTLGTRIEAGGLSLSDSRHWTPRQALDGAAPALVGEKVTLRQSVPVDGSGLGSGRYSYRFTSRAQYDCSTVGGSHDAEFYVQDGTDSPYGNGWSIDRLQRLVLGPDGKVTITDDDSVTTFDPQPTLTEFEDEPLIFPTVGTAGIGSGDADGDGDIDVFYGESGTGSLGVLTNLGDGAFQQEDTLRVANPSAVPQTGLYPPNLAAIAVGELTNDGAPDMAYVMQTQEGYGYAENDGFGSFFKAFESLGLGRRALDVAVGDIDRDGYDDIIYVANSGFFTYLTDEIWISYGGPNGRTLVKYAGSTFGGAGALQVIVDDVDGNGFDDVALRTRQGMDFLFNNGNRSYSRKNLRAGNGGLNVLGNFGRLADFNGDGKLDIAYATPNDLQILLNTTGQAFGAPRLLPRPPSASDATPVNLGDADGDGIVDLIVTSGREIAVYRSNGDGTFAPFEIGLVDYGFSDTELADLNGDGSLDLISTQRFSVTVHFSKPSASGTFVSGKGEFSTLERLADGTWQRRYKDGTVIEYDAAGLQTAVVDPQGNRKEYGYGPDGRLATIVDQVGGVTSFAYDGEGRLASISYPDGRTTTFTYDDIGNLTDIAEPAGSKVGFAYDANGRLISTTNQNGNTTSYSYDAVGNLNGATLPDSSSVKNQVAASLGLVDGLGGPATQPLIYVKPEDRVTTVTDRKGEVTTVEVNQFGSVIRVTDPLGRTSRFIRDESNLVTRVERPGANGSTRVDTLEYDDVANVTAMTEAVGTPAQRTTRYGYEPVFSKVTTTTDAGGFVTAYENDATGLPTRVTDPEGGTRLMTYTAQGQLASRTDENGNATQFAYDARGNLASVTYADGSVTQTTYDASGNVTTLAEASGSAEERVRKATYDLLNRPISQIDALSNAILYGYDPVGNLTRFEDAAGRVSVIYFDELNREVGGNDPITGDTTVSYSVGETEIVSTDAEGRTDRTEFDILGRPSKIVEAHGAAREGTYNSANQVATMIDAKGGTASFQYDDLGRTVVVQEPSGEIVTTQYDVRNNVVGVVSANGDAVSFGYDGNGRLLTMATADNAYMYSYDAAGNVLQTTDNDTSISATYDAMNRLASETFNYPNLPAPVVLSYEYDTLGRKTRTTDSFGGTVEINYDAENRQTSVTQPWGGSIDFTYDPDGRVRSKTYQNGTVTFANYDAGGRLAGLKHSFAGLDFLHESFRYDRAGRLIELRDELDLTKSRALLHDAGRRLVGVNVGLPVSEGGMPIPAEDYSYDLEDNRTASHLTSGYEYDANHRLLETASYRYTYDANGNRTSRTGRATGETLTYSWDAQDQLIGVSSTDGWSVSYLYDAQQRRIGKTVTGTEGAVTEQAFVYDGPNVLFVFTTRDGVTTSRRWMNAYGLDKRYGFEDYASATPTPGTGARYEVHTDYLGSIAAVVDSAIGAVVSRYRYDSFGRRSVVAEAVDPGYGFTGQQYDAETGLQYHRARYYDPAEGRFLSTDPLGFPDGPRNAYVYVANTPYQKIDPLGLNATSPFLAFANDATSNGIYAELVTGGAMGYLLKSLGEAADFLGTLYGAGGSGSGMTFGGNMGRSPFNPFEAMNEKLAQCHSLNSSDKFNFDDLNTGRTHGGPAHDAMITWRMNDLAAQKGAKMIKGAIDVGSFMKDRPQVNAGFERVSTCRPDLQYNFAGGELHMLEEMSVSSAIYREVAKAIVMLRADPNAAWLLWRGRRR